MAYAAIGLKTHIWNNNLKSLLLLASFPLLLFIMLWMVLTASDYALALRAGVSARWLVSMGNSVDTATAYAPYVLLGTGIWFAVAWVGHTTMIRRATGAKGLKRTEAPELYNMLENLCISRGIPMPKLAVIESPALNAFASGINAKTYTVTVTRGLLNTLEPEEVEAVLAHELAHIMNKDVRLLIISVIFVGIFAFIAEIAVRKALLGARSGRGDGKSKFIVLIVTLLVAVVGYLFAVLIRFALSRKREYLADAGAVELTKNPQALISALEKISGQHKMDEVPAEVRQMFIENTAASSLFATHPPIKKRIAALRAVG